MDFQDSELQASTTQGRKAERSHCKGHTAPIQGDRNTERKLKSKKRIMHQYWTSRMKTIYLLMKLLRAVQKVGLQRSLNATATNLLVILLTVPPSIALVRELGAVADIQEDISLHHLTLPSPSLPICNLSLMTANQSTYSQRDSLMVVYSITLRLQSVHPSRLLPQSLATSPLSLSNQY